MARTCCQCLKVCGGTAMLKRVMFQLYITNCDEAIKFYQEAFDGKILCDHRNPDNSVAHAEMEAFGQIIAFTEWSKNKAFSMTMEFCFHFEKGQEAAIQKAYNVLKDGAMIWSALEEPCGYAECQFELIDKYGVFWCLFC